MRVKTKIRKTLPRPISGKSKEWKLLKNSTRRRANEKNEGFSWRKRRLDILFKGEVGIKLIELWIRTEKTKWGKRRVKICIELEFNRAEKRNWKS